MAGPHSASFRDAARDPRFADSVLSCANGAPRLKLGIAVGLAFCAILVAIVLVEAVSFGGQVVFRMSGSVGDEIRWAEGLEPVRVWDPNRHARIDARYRDWVERELRAGRIDLAVQAMRRARARAKARGLKPDAALIDVGLETYTRAADRMQRHGQLSRAADWNDTLFVFAVRDPDPRHRAAASAAFLEGLGLRVKDGKPCDALSRVAWARKGLGGEIPDLDPAVEASLSARCEEQQRVSGGMR
jgi:hypothetical protein